MSKRKVDYGRRLVVGGGVAAAAALYLAGFVRGALKSCSAGEGNGALVDLRPLVRIGDAYLGEAARRGELAALYRDLRSEGDSGAEGAVLNRLPEVRGRARDEFDRGETVICDGWVLAKSEARLCAHAAFVARSAAAG